MRVRLSIKNLERLFSKVLSACGNWRDVAIKAEVSIRTLSDWRRGKITMPIKVFDNFVNLAKLNKNDLRPSILSDFWHIKDAARKGAVARMKLYGNFATEEGRRRGGLTSVIIHRKLGNRFKTLKSIRKPSRSDLLAELLGIFIGDGHLSEYQATVTTNSETDKEHALFVQKIIKDLFNVSSVIKNRSDENTITVIASAKNLVKFLNDQGMPIGNKIQQNLAIPTWIYKKRIYQMAFIRGLFDTDGCIYLDIHKIKNKIYKNLGWTITSASDKLIKGIISVLKNLGFSPTNRFTQKSVYLRRKKDIKRYFDEVGTSNPKHYRRYIKFIGGVPKWS